MVAGGRWQQLCVLVWCARRGRVRRRSGGQRQRMSALKNLFSPPPIGGGKEEPELEPEPEPEQPRRLNVRLTQG